METRVPLPWFWTRSAPSVRSLSPADWSPQSCDCPGKPPHSHRSSLWPVHRVKQYHLKSFEIEIWTIIWRKNKIMTAQICSKHVIPLRKYLSQLPLPKFSLFNKVSVKISVLILHFHNLTCLALCSNRMYWWHCSSFFFFSVQFSST